MAIRVVIQATLLALACASHPHHDGYEYPAPVVAFTAVPPHAHSTISSYSTHQHHDTHVVAAPVVDVHPHGVASYAQHAEPISYVHTDSAVHSDYGISAPVVHGIHSDHHVEPSAPAHYDFGYSVTDPHTGDAKSQHETRRGDVVSGSYSLVDSDGTRRTVDYTADAIHGFNAVVHKDPIVHGAHIVTAAPLIYSDGHHQAVSHHDAVSHYETVTQSGW